MTRWLDHLLVLPVVLPLVAGAVMLLIDEQHRILKTAISIGTIVALTGVALALLTLVDAPDSSSPLLSAETCGIRIARSAMLRVPVTP